jgi:hypothetical protein
VILSQYQYGQWTLLRRLQAVCCWVSVRVLASVGESMGWVSSSLSGCSMTCVSHASKISTKALGLDGKDEGEAQSVRQSSVMHMMSGKKLIQFQYYGLLTAGGL